QPHLVLVLLATNLQSEGVALQARVMLELQLVDQRTQRFGWITGTQSPDEGCQRFAICFYKLHAPAVVLVEVAGALLYRASTSLTIGNENQLFIPSPPGPV